MWPGEHKLYAKQGADFSETFQYLDNADEPINLLGATIEARIRRNVDDSAAAASFVCTVVDPDEAIFTLAMADTVLDGLSLDAVPDGTFIATDFVYDVEVTFLSGQKETLMEGLYRVKPQASKA